MVTLKVPLVGSKETHNNYEVLSLAFLTATMYMKDLFVVVDSVLVVLVISLLSNLFVFDRF